MHVANWLSVIGYEGLYEVSDMGEVRSVNRVVMRQGKLLRRSGRSCKNHTNRNGYLLVWLSKGGRSLGYSVHQLVARAFIGLPAEGEQVNHKNGVKTDNRPSNLEWLTFTENVRHSYRELGRKNLPGELRKNARPVSMYTKSGVLLRSYQTLHEASADTGVLATSITNCIGGRSKTAGGFLWVALPRL